MPHVLDEGDDDGDGDDQRLDRRGQRCDPLRTEEVTPRFRWRRRSGVIVGHLSGVTSAGNPK
jgi:hypothetical protein